MLLKTYAYDSPDTFALTKHTQKTSYFIYNPHVMCYYVAVYGVVYRPKQQIYKCVLIYTNISQYIKIFFGWTPLFVAFVVPTSLINRCDITLHVHVIGIGLSRVEFSSFTWWHGSDLNKFLWKWRASFKRDFTVKKIVLWCCYLY